MSEAKEKYTSIKAWLTTAAKLTRLSQLTGKPRTRLIDDLVNAALETETLRQVERSSKQKKDEA